MSKTLNLSEVTEEIIKQHIQVMDSSLTQYIKSAVGLLQHQGKDITDYALVVVNNPMTLKDNNRVTISSQWRVVPISELENLPTYLEETV